MKNFENQKYKNNKKEIILNNNLLKELLDNLEKEEEKIEINININELSEEEKLELEDLIQFSKNLSYVFKKKFIYLLNTYVKERRKIDSKIINFIIEKEWLLPQFQILKSDSAEKFLDKVHLNDRFYDKNNFLIVFQIPRPLAKYWWKGGADAWGYMDETAVDLEAEVIEWGHFYRSLMRVVWSTMDYYYVNLHYKFNRLNEIGEHDSRNYYYVWELLANFNEINNTDFYDL